MPVTFERRHGSGRPPEALLAIPCKVLREPAAPVGYPKITPAITGCMQPHGPFRVFGQAPVCPKANDSNAHRSITQRVPIVNLAAHSLRSGRSRF